ncbi:unnamed protein product [Vicia faba]|uniref:Uncharacterized protein n=1 Tax=Vicia faba TaxID=3906 RepID=A0AAV0ZRD4_VICFA|nr:unnamed protein product [Vicia faba]
MNCGDAPSPWLHKRNDQTSLLVRISQIHFYNLSVVFGEERAHSTGENANLAIYSKPKATTQDTTTKRDVSNDRIEETNIVCIVIVILEDFFLKTILNFKSNAATI